MGEVKERLLDINCDEDEASEQIKDPNPKNSCFMQLRWWIELTMYTFLSIGGQSCATLLGKDYFDQGGNSKWLVATLQNAGFPLLIIPFLLLSSTKKSNQETRNKKTTITNNCPPSLEFEPNELTNKHNTNHPGPPSNRGSKPCEWVSGDKGSDRSPTFLMIASVYTCLGLLLAVGGVFYSVSIECIPASTYSLLNSTQLAFTAILALFINAQKFTPYILNSVVLLTISPIILVFENESTSSNYPSITTNNGVTDNGGDNKFMLGVLFTIVASAAFALMFSLTELAFEKVISGGETLAEALKMTIWQSVVATVVTLFGLFGSGEWESLKGEMKGYKLGVFWYFVNLAGTAASCQAFYVSSIALTFKVSSLFSNVVIRLATPVVPFLSVIFLHETMSGLKFTVLLLSVWGFVSYIYQQYLDDLKADDVDKNQSNEDLTFKDS